MGNQQTAHRPASQPRPAPLPRPRGRDEVEADAAIPVDAASRPAFAADGILWPPGEPPCFGDQAIAARLAAGGLPQPLGGAIDLAPSGDHALERGCGVAAGQRVGYLRVWRRSRRGEWQVAREVWDGTGTDAGSVTQTSFSAPWRE